MKGDLLVFASQCKASLLGPTKTRCHVCAMQMMNMVCLASCASTLNITDDLVQNMSPVQFHWIAVANTEVHSMQGSEYAARRNLYKKELTCILTEVKALNDGKSSKLLVEIAGHLRELGEL